jgi:CheY-like chemotaxis protein/two-component sensor histidine kinase
LAFSRRQPLSPRPLDLNVLIREMTELLHQTLGETIELENVISPRLWPVEVDQNQLEAAILNLAVNARDAMPKGGKLTIETANTALDQSYSAHDAEVVPGQYVMLSISDNGEGMSQGTLARAFEPFYTTKEVGKGTGLGLSMVYGFVKQSSGHVTIYSEEGHGTTVKIYFPRFEGDVNPASDDKVRESSSANRNEVILVVEDNRAVRANSVDMLTELGYKVLEAGDGIAAMRILERTGRVDLLFTDVVLPGENGRLLADRALIIRPGLRVLFTTGYSRHAIVHQGRLDSHVHLISKPFTFEQLAAKVRDVLDMPPHSR